MTDQQPQTTQAPPRTHPQFLCPYCGHVSANAQRCDHCKGLFEPLSRQATQNAMGPWHIRSADNPHQPGCAHATLASLIAKKKVTRNTILRGPTTRQFWSFACNAPGVAVLLGECHSCHHKVKPDEYMCPSCNAVLSPPTDRQHLGLAPIKLLPGQATPEAIASSSMASSGGAGGVGGSGSVARATPVGAPHAASAPHASRTAHHPAPRAPRPSDPSAPAPTPSAARGRETTRRLRDRLRFMTGAFIFAIIINVALLVIFTVIMLADSSSLRIGSGSKADDAPATPQQQQSPNTSGSESGPLPDDTFRRGPVDEPTEAGAPNPESGDPTPDATGATPPTPTPPAHDLDAGLDPWAADIRQASDLEKTDSVEDLERAVAILERVQGEARAAAIAEGAESPAFPLLQARIDRLTERIDRLSLRDMFE